MFKPSVGYNMLPTSEAEAVTNLEKHLEALVGEIRMYNESLAGLLIELHRGAEREKAVISKMIGCLVYMKKDLERLNK